MEEVKVKCDVCSHKEVCRFKEQYLRTRQNLADIKALDRENEDWMYPLEPNCKHYRSESSILNPVGGSTTYASVR